MSLAVLQSIICTQVASLLVPCSRPSLTISNGLSRFSRMCQPPSFVRKMGSSSRELGFDFRVCGRSGPASRSEERMAPSVGFPPISRHQHRGFTIRFESLRISVSPSAFLPLSTICSPRSLAGLFHPAATCWVHPPRAFPAA